MAFRRRRYNTRRSVVGRRVKRAVKKYKLKRRVSKRIPRAITTQANIPRIQKLRYCEEILLTSTLGVRSDYVFRANSLYDPNYSAGGHQPARFDQLALFYADYVVVGAKITVKQMGQYNTDAVGPLAPYIMTLYLDDDPTTSLTTVGMIENGKCKYKLSNDSSDVRTTLVSKFSAKKFFNVVNIKDNVKRIGAGVGANPADEAYFRLAIEPMDASSTVSARCLVTIDYLAIFSQPVDLAQS